MTCIALGFIMAYSADPTIAVVHVDWTSTALDFKTTAIPTYLNQVNPSMDRESPIHDPVFKNMDQLGAKLVRYLHWSHSQAPFPEKEEGVFNWTLTDQYVDDFMKCKNAQDSVINFDAAPAWLHENADLNKPLRDPTGTEVGEWISRIVSWYTKGGFTDKRTGKVYKSLHHFQWRNYEVLNEPNLKRYMGASRTNGTRALCKGGADSCAMISEPLDLYYSGTYSGGGRPAITSQADCEAACLLDQTCVQMTWAPANAKTKYGACVLYSSISTSQIHTTVSVKSSTKCAHNEKDPATCAAFSGNVPAYEEYTRIYDGIAAVLTRDHPELQLHAVSLAQSGGLAQDNLAAVYDDHWFSYFFNATNHAPGAKPPAFVTYHFYAFPGHDTGSEWGNSSRWPVDSKGRAVQLPMDQWPVHLFKQAVRFVKRAEHVNQLVSNGTFGGNSVDISVNEVGVIGGSLCPTATLFTSASSYWNLKAALWAYYYGELARQGAAAIASSQITGYPPGTWNIRGKPVANNFPCVSMLDWHDGSGTAVFWALQMFIDVLGSGRKTIVNAHTVTGAAGVGAAQQPYWPLPSTVYSIGFVLEGSGTRIVLLANTNSSAATAHVAGVTSGAKMHIVDASAGHGLVPYATHDVQNGTVTLSPLAVVLLELKSE
jgi:hypothetical protein